MMIILEFKPIIHNLLVAMPFGDFVILEPNEFPDLLIIRIMFEFPHILDKGWTMDRIFLGDNRNVP